ncbi:hypothetical protein V8F20_007128 [Naviculisporaceae sp. PSN 640]
MASTDLFNQPFDFVIIGGGTAGLVLANRLSEDPSVRVVVIEAGADRTTDPLVLTPGLVPALYGKDEYDWDFASVPQPNLHNRRVFQPRGKMLGGSSALNFMMLVHPNKNILDGWSQLGNTGWDYASLAPYFKKFVSIHPPSQSARDAVGGLAYHRDLVLSGNGPVQAMFSEGYGANNKAWFDTFKELGLDLEATKKDPREGEAVGAFQSPATIDPKTKTRSFAGSAYLTEDVRKRSNLVVVTETRVSKIVFDLAGEEPVAVGVEVVTRDGVKGQVTAAREVILCAGALQSPQILELSGVGNKEILKKYGIPVVVDNPNVGEGAQDHPIVIQSFEVADGVVSGDVLRDPAVVQAVMELYQTSGEGPLGQSIISSAYLPMANGSGVLSTDDKTKVFAKFESQLNLPGHDIQRKVLERDDGPAYQYLLFPTQANVSESTTGLADILVPSAPENFISVFVALNHPFSRGSVHITANEPGRGIEWDPKYNDNALDEEILAGGVQFIEKLIHPSTPLGKLLKPGGRRLPQIVADSVENAKEIVRQRQISVFHVSGTCAMLPREKGGVVDERLRVHGVKGLRVVDASVFPLEPSGNIQSVVYAVAEKAADMVKADWVC